MFQNQWQENNSFAQNFIYDNKAKHVVVGSSMAARMKNDFLPSYFYNLSFSGGSVLTGLEIIKRSGFIPQNIYIENNVIFRGKDSQMINFLFYPILWRIKKYVPALKDEYQPLNLLVSMLKGSYGKTHKEYMNEKRDEVIFKSSLLRQIKSYNNLLENYESKLDDLKRIISYFEEKGVEIIFFEMPIHNTLANSIKANMQREIIKKNFQNCWIELPDNNLYDTIDGVHLMYRSAYEYVQVFLREVDKKSD